MNHTEIVNMVSEGVRQAIETRQPPGTINNIQDNQQHLDLQQQLDEMKALVDQLRTDNQAIQVSNAQPPAIPFHDVTIPPTTTNHTLPHPPLFINPTKAYSIKGTMGMEVVTVSLGTAGDPTGITFKIFKVADVETNITARPTACTIIKVHCVKPLWRGGKKMPPATTAWEETHVGQHEGVGSQGLPQIAQLEP